MDFDHSPPTLATQSPRMLYLLESLFLSQFLSGRVLILLPSPSVSNLWCYLLFAAALMFKTSFKTFNPVFFFRNILRANVGMKCRGVQQEQGQGSRTSVKSCCCDIAVLRLYSDIRLCCNYSPLPHNRNKSFFFSSQ